MVSNPSSVNVEALTEQNNNNHQIMPQGKEVFAGLNQTGLIAFIILLIACFPLCWLPWVINNCKSDPKATE